MKKELRKLSLKRETLTPMNDEELAGVNGGFTGALVRSAIAVSRWSSRGCASGAVVEASAYSIQASRQLFSADKK